MSPVPFPIAPVVLAATLILARPAAGGPAPADPAVLARVYGEPITWQDLAEELYFEHRAEALVRIQSERVIEHEQARRKVTVTVRQVDLKLEEMIAVLSVKENRNVAVDDVAKALGTTRQDLRRRIRLYVSTEVMMKQDAIWVPGGFLSPLVNDAIGRYLRDLGRKTRLELDPLRLPAGIDARVGPLVVTRREVMRRVLAAVDDEDRAEALKFLVEARVLAKRARDAKLAPPTEADRRAHLEFMRLGILSDPDWRRVIDRRKVLEQFLQETRKTDLETFRRSRTFHLNVQLTRLAAQRVREADLKSLFARDPNRFGHGQREALHIRTFAFPQLRKRPRTQADYDRWKKAREHAELVMNENPKRYEPYFQGALQMITRFRKMVLGEDGVNPMSFKTVAQQYSQALDGGSGGRLGFVGHRHKLLAPEVIEAIYATPLGEVSAPVRDTYGYHVVKPLRERTTTFEKARPFVRQAGMAVLRREIRKSTHAAAQTHVVRYEERLGATPPLTLTPPNRPYR